MTSTHKSLGKWMDQCWQWYACRSPFMKNRIKGLKNCGSFAHCLANSKGKASLELAPFA
ncbi:hypothetical protein J2S74_001836 [Evansella vedderi]|uniref:Uncharacterized protein n=1 Tax=Evansella vedderi TaxID=38282 RepID=A0ABT9ZUQ6_9BACI|nr:hypothetical protein [Evansella vedderi]